MNQRDLSKLLKISYKSLAKHEFILRTLFHIKRTFLDKPRTLMIHPHFECNFNCDYCYLKERKGKTLPFSKWKQLISEARAMGVYSIDFLGGEPLMYQHFKELINYVLNHGLLLNIFTNGALITKKLLEQLKPHSNRIIFVLKFDSPSCYEQMYKFDFNKILDTATLLREFGFKTLAFVVVTKKNFFDVERILELCDEKRIVPIFERYAPVKSSKVNDSLAINKEDWYSVLKLIEAYWRNYSEWIKFYSVINGGVCSSLSNNMAIMQNGDVKPCPEASDDLNYGNVERHSLKHIWEHSNGLRNQFLEIPSECKNCSNKYECRGGCKIYTYQTFGKLNKKDPLCNGEIPTTLPHCAFSLLRFITPLQTPHEELIPKNSRIKPD